MSRVVLYGADISPPVRTCLLTLKALNIPFEYKFVDIVAREHFSEEFIKKNPQHTVPLLEDNGKYIWDSHAICSYLVDKYGQNDKLYPKDLYQRAIVNQRLYFDASILYMALRNVVLPMWRENSNFVPKDKIMNILECYNLTETFLENRQYIAGDSLTIADFGCLATVSSLNGIIELDKEKYPKTLEWIERLSKLPYYEEGNGKGLREYVAILKSRLTEFEM
ncbi:glutathione S-transferase 1-like [Teleopsis dalmanni]|uniref:glutathione S-transferase 1-like n=1 Tax=Teleopsis dalmanni TaxID=139649 RepID=UPI0018CEB39D|nr:glutathione S-transferase 1-like [Teleopsis dalmanni]